jgi:predicted PurR-regulated permease PerM
MEPNSTVKEQGWFSRERVLLVVLGLATLVALYICYLIVQPFMPAIVIASAVAIATKRPHNGLRSRLRSNAAAAAVSVILLACLIVVPLTLLITYLVHQIIGGVQQLQAMGGLADWRSILQLPPLLDRALQWAEANLDLQSQFTRLGQGLAAQAGGVLAGSVNLLTQIVILHFVLFFMYRDRDRALDALRALVPLSEQETNRIFARVEDTILATVNGSLTVAFVQAVLAGIMYTALGVPASVIWASATFVVALVPVFGTFMVWGPVAVFLLLSGSWIKALILVGWGMLAVGSIDNVLYPYLVGGRLRMHTVPTFFSILGGVGLFGPAGLFLGPIALAVTMGLLQVWWWRTRSGRTAEQASPGIESAPARQQVEPSSGPSL